jgi:hypothetical protein
MDDSGSGLYLYSVATFDFILLIDTPAKRPESCIWQYKEAISIGLALALAKHLPSICNAQHTSNWYPLTTDSYSYS